MKKTENKKVPQSLVLSPKGRKGQSGEQKSPSRGGGFRGSFNTSPVLVEVGMGNELTKGRWRKAFTLVELIIVITILAILATIAFMSFQGYSSKSRDSNRLTTASNLQTGFGVFQAKSWVYPVQSTGAQISVSGTVVTVQWNLDENIARVINMNEVPKDPKTGEMYHYISDTKGIGYKVLYYLENLGDYAYLTQSYAENESRTPMVKGNWPWVVLDMERNLVTGNIDLFGNEISGSYRVMVDENIEVSWSGLELGGGFENFAKKWGNLDAPKTCPTGYIPVPWNAEFMQPWFCVMKYEATYADADIPDSCDVQYPNICTSYQDFNTVRYQSWMTAVSMPWKLSIANIIPNFINLRLTFL